MSELSLTSLRTCLEGAIPSEIVTCDGDGMPSISAISDVHYIDADHVAISHQFCHKTRANLRADPQATVLLLHPRTCALYRLRLRYERTEHEGMSGISNLLGTDIYRVVAIDCAQPDALTPPRASPLAALRQTLTRLDAARDLDGVVATLLAQLEAAFKLPHVMLLMANAAGDRLYTLASQGYPESGIGAEILPGQGVIGLAARDKTPIRLIHATRDDLYGRAIRDTLRESPLAAQLETEIPLPGIAASASQIAVPILSGGRLLGVLYAESPEVGRFGYDEEDALVILASRLAVAIGALSSEVEDNTAAPTIPPPADAGAPLVIRHYRADDSVFVDDQYVIKGVAGAILWLLLCEHVKSGRTEFSNKELRLSPQIRLPEYSENLEARIILLRRRLAERSRYLSLDKAGRGRFRLCLTRPIELIEVGSAEVAAL